MKRFACVLLVGLISIATLHKQSPAQAIVPTYKWTYAVFRMMTINGSSTYQWYSDGQHCEETSFSEFVNHLPAPAPNSTSGSKVIDVLNQVGAAGWELTTSDITRTETTEVERFFFKRPG